MLTQGPPQYKTCDDSSVYVPSESIHPIAYPFQEHLRQVLVFPPVMYPMKQMALVLVGGLALIFPSVLGVAIPAAAAGAVGPVGGDDLISSYNGLEISHRSPEDIPPPLNRENVVGTVIGFTNRKIVSSSLVLLSHPAHNDAPFGSF